MPVVAAIALAYVEGARTVRLHAKNILRTSSHVPNIQSIETLMRSALLLKASRMILRTCTCVRGKNNSCRAGRYQLY